MNFRPALGSVAGPVLALAVLLACQCGWLGAEPAAPAPSTRPTAGGNSDADAEPELSESDQRLIATAGGQEPDLDKVNALLDQGADPNALGGAPLCRAVMRDRPAVVKLLLERGAKPDGFDGCRTALGYAAVLGYTDLAELLIDKGADVNRGPFLPLHDATGSCKPEVVMLLIGRGADVNAPAVSGRTALHTAARHGTLWVEQLLLAAGADVNARDRDGRTPLFYAVANNEKDAAVLLLSYGADVNPTDLAGQSLLAFARKSGEQRMLNLLVERGARE